MKYSNIHLGKRVKRRIYIRKERGMGSYGSIITLFSVFIIFLDSV